MAEQDRARFRRHYAANPDYHRERKQTRQEQMRQWIASLKIGKSCKTCGETHPACLTFHHRDPSEKKFKISSAAARGVSKEAVLAEVKKCDVLCANCHLILHYDEKNPDPG